MPPERAAALETLPGWTWSVPAARFQHHVAALADYRARHGDCEPPPGHVHNGINLGAWVAQIRRLHAAGDLAGDQVAALEVVAGWSWTGPPSAQEQWQSAWDQAYRMLHEWAADHGHAHPPSDVVVGGRRLGQWVLKQRARRDTMTPDRADRLQALPGWRWTASR
jgi:hypothetical protein